MSSPFLLLLIFVPVAVFCVMSYIEAKHAHTPIRFLQYGAGYRSPSFFATLLASNSSLSGALFLIAFYGLLYGPPVFLWVFIFWFSTQFMSFYTVKWVESIDPTFIERRGTLHEFLAKLFGNDQNVRVAAANTSMFCYVGLLASEIVIGYGIISEFVPTTTPLLGRLALEPAVVTLAVVGLIAFYCTMAGFRGVVRTDEIQLLLVALMMVAISLYLKSMVLLLAIASLMLVGCVSWVYYSLRPFAARTPVSENPQPIPASELTARDVLHDLRKRWLPLLAFGTGIVVWLFASKELGHLISWRKVINPTEDPWQKFVPFFVVANVLFWLVWWPSAMDQWHRCAATTDSRVSQHWLLGTLGVLPILYLGLLSLTFLFLGANVRNPDVTIADPLAAFLGTLDSPDVRSAFFVIVAIGLLAAMVSTIDSYLVVATQTWIIDIRTARATGRSLWQIEGENDNASVLGQLRVAVPLLFLGAAVLAIPLLVVLSDVYAAIYFFFSGMLVLAGIIGVGFFVKNRQRRNTMAVSVKRAIIIGMTYVVVSNIPIMIMLEMTLRGAVKGDAWYQKAQNWYYAVYSNPVIAMFVTAVGLLVHAARVRSMERNRDRSEF